MHFQDIETLNNSFYPCSRVYLKHDSFERLPKLMDVLYPLVENKEVKYYTNSNLLFDKTLMIDDTDLAHFQNVCEYRIEDCGGMEYNMNLNDAMFPIVDNYLDHLLFECESGEAFHAIGYIENVMTLNAKHTITHISHESQRETLNIVLPKLGLSSTVFNLKGFVNNGKLHLNYFSPKIVDFINMNSVDFCTNAFRQILKRSF